MTYILRFIAILLFCLAMVCSGCQFEQTQKNTTSTIAYEVTDIQGTTLQMQDKPKRILTLSMETDEIVLGLVRPDHLVAVNALLDDPGESTVVPLAKEISQKITNPSVEAIAAMQPDLVIIPDWGDLEKVAPLRELGIKVLVCKGSHNVGEIKETVSLIATALGEQRRGTELIRQMDERIRIISDKVARIPIDQRKSVVLLSLMNTYGGIGCVFDDACSYAGVINGMAVAGIYNGQALSKEMLVKINPDFLFLPAYTNHGTYNPQGFINEYLDDPALQSMKAIRNGHLVMPRESYIYNSSQDIVFGIQEIANAVYGSSFAQADGLHLTAVDFE